MQRGGKMAEKLQWAARLQTGYEGNLTPQQEKDLESFREFMLATEFAEDLKNNPEGIDRKYCDV